MSLLNRILGRKRAEVEEEYKLFKGIYREQMPLLVAQGYKPATTEQIMQGRLEKTLAYNYYYDTSTGIFYAGNNQDKFKILPYSEVLARVNPKTSLYDGGIRQTEEEYESSNGIEFTRKDMILNQGLTEEEVIKHQGWLELANNNQALLQEYIQSTFKLFKYRNGEDKAMGFYIRNPEKVPNIRAVCLLRLDDRSDASDGYGLYEGARFVGVSEGTRKKYPTLPRPANAHELDTRTLPRPANSH